MSNIARNPEASWEAVAEAVCERIAQQTGNVLDPRQMPMVLAQLRRHLAELKLGPAGYLSYWRVNGLNEDLALVGLLTTHFTSFFRDFLHFEWLADELPELVALARHQNRNEIRIWSAACGRGQEVWSLAMWLHFYLPKIAPDFTWSIHGTDVDARSVKQAINGVFHQRELQTAPRHLWQSLWQRGAGDNNNWLRVKQVLRSHCQFSTDNLLAPKMPSSEKFDVIFCRNVLGHLSAEDQRKAADNLLSYLRPDGVLVTGVSESLSHLLLTMKSLAPSVYSTRQQGTVNAVAKAKMAAPTSIPKPLRVLCVEDSPAMIKTLKKLLATPDFEIVGTAANGLEALALLETCRPDVVTLDLQMPGMDGFTLVRESDVAVRLPVLVVSSVDRTDASLVQPLFERGICDFLEKPSFETLNEIGDELRQKLKMAWWAKQRGSVVQETAPLTISQARAPGRIILNAGFADRNALRSLLQLGKFDNDEVYLNIKADAHLWQDWLLELKRECPFLALKIESSPTWVYDGKVAVLLHYLGGDKKCLAYARAQNAIILLEETDWPNDVRSQAVDTIPATSFAYKAHKFLEGR